MSNKRIFKVNVVIPPSIVGIIRRLSRAKQGDLIEQMGRDVSCKFGAFFMDASKRRHKVARKYGVQPTGILEFSSTYPPRSRGGGEINSARRGNTAVLTISGVPFLSRAFGALNIQPKKAHCLTIPINRISVHKRAADLKREGWSLFTLGNRMHITGLSRNRRGILFGYRNGDLVPLFALVKNVIIPQDKGLMPSEAIIGSWAAESAKRFIGI